MRPPAIRQTGPFDLDGLESLVGVRALGRLRRLAGDLHEAVHDRSDGATIWHVNSSGFGGGVADILSSIVPLSTMLGVGSSWLVIGGDERFFQVTKAFHNALQGDASAEITADMLEHYEVVTAANGWMLDEVIRDHARRPPDVIVLHDPQTAGLITRFRDRFPRAKLIWHGHLEFDARACATAHPARAVWALLARYVNQADAAVFHLPAYVPDGLTTTTRCFLPSINPMGYINRALRGPTGARFIRATLEKYRMDPLVKRSVPLVMQLGRFDPWKDPLGVLQAYREACGRLNGDGRRPHLLLVGPLAADDPEAHGILGRLAEHADGEGTVHVLPLSPADARATVDQAAALASLGIDPDRLSPADLIDLEINAFQTRADVVVAKSLREGFGLAVTGAGYHGKARIVTRVGGLPAQVIDERGRAHACLVSGPPDLDREASIAGTRDWLVTLLASPRLRARLGAGAQRHVIRAFLPHRHLENYFRLFHELARPRDPARPGGDGGGRPRRARATG